MRNHSLINPDKLVAVKKAGFSSIPLEKQSRIKSVPGDKDESSIGAVKIMKNIN